MRTVEENPAPIDERQRTNGRVCARFGRLFSHGYHPWVGEVWAVRDAAHVADGPLTLHHGRRSDTTTGSGAIGAMSIWAVRNAASL